MLSPVSVALGKSRVRRTKQAAGQVYRSENPADFAVYAGPVPECAAAACHDWQPQSVRLVAACAR